MFVKEKTKALVFVSLFIPFFLFGQFASSKKIINEALDSVPSLGSILVWHNDRILIEEYFNGADKQTDFNIKSITKSVVSALAGIACDMHLLPDVNTPIVDILPEYSSTNSFKKNLSLEDVLTMRTGILWNDNDPTFKWRSSDGIKDYLELPFGDMPGTKFRYSTPASHLFGAALSRCIKTDLLTFADSALFIPIGVSVSDWPKDKLGRRNGGSELKMKATDLMKFGLLYLNNGKINGKQIISEAWIRRSTSGQVALNNWDVMPNANGYGYYWWRRKVGDHQAFVASGYGGQLICVIPGKQIVIVTTCFLNDDNRGRSEIKRLHAIIDKIVNAI